VHPLCKREVSRIELSPQHQTGPLLTPPHIYIYSTHTTPHGAPAPRPHLCAIERNTQSTPQTHHPNSQWIRPLREEGIEPHPGPRYIGRNVNGLASQGRFIDAMRSITAEHRKSPVAAVLIQEHNLRGTQDRELRLYARRRHRLLWLARYRPASETSGKGHGTAIVIPIDSIERKDSTETVEAAIARVTKSLTGSKCGRVTSARTLVNGKTIKLVSAYAPAKGSSRPTFITNTLAPHVTNRTMLSIDANCVPDAVLDTQRPATTSEYENGGASELADLIRSRELADVARDQLGPGKLFTAHHTNIHGQISRTRIDQLYAPNVNDLLWTHSTNHTFLPPRQTLPGPPDHIGLELTLEIAQGQPGRDLPRINPSIYTDPTTHHLVEECLTRHFDPDGATPADMCSAWSECKAEIRTISLQRTKELRLRDTEKATFLKQLITQTRKNIESGTASAGEDQLLAAKLKELKDLAPPERTLNQTLENVAYSKGQLHDSGSAAMYRRLHTRSSDQWVNAVMRAKWDDPSSPTEVSATPTSDADKIADGFVAYYEALFARKDPEPAALNKCMDALKAPHHRQVLPPTAAACGADVTPAEVLEHCASLPTSKSPGPDRLPNDFYKTHRAKLAPILAKVFNQAHERGHLPPEMTEGLISVLYKKKDRTDPRNYRPITLLNGDYKILMRVLTARVNKAAVQFVSDPQNGFVPGGFIVENIILLQLLQAIAEEEDLEALLIFLDFEKAFDRCSWDYLSEAIRNLGFPNQPANPSSGDASRPHPFLAWVKLAYSHDHPPTRKMHVNGYVSRSFALASGVAQGCPLSPLLFLIVTEALTRLILDDTRIKGIEVDGMRHKISQYADDSTLIATPQDVPFFNEHLRTYIHATRARENVTKREAQLLGKLAREPHLAPSGVVKDDAYPSATESTRALGYPIGHAFSNLAWWRAKYREAKTKAARMNPFAHASIVGRNMILQAKFYSYFRFWLFGLLMPTSVRKHIESDAKNMIWAAAPDLRGDEDGTSAAVAPQLAAAPSFLPVREGGAGLMHWHSHIIAFQLQWVLRYVDPRRAPWKQVLDHWIATPHHIGRKITFVPHQRDAKSLASHLPTRLKYLRSCFREFQKLPLTQDTSTVTPHVAAEPLFENARFHIPLSRQQVFLWHEHLQVTNISDLIDRDTSDLFTDIEWNDFFYRLAPDPHARHANNFADNRARELPSIINSIPPDVLTAARAHPTDPPYVAFVGQDQYTIVTWAACVTDDTGSTTYTEVWLDANAIPHPTGRTIPFTTPLHAVPAATWTHPKPEPADAAHEDDADATPGLAPAAHAGVTRILGTVDTAFPMNEGWHLEGSKHTTLTQIFNIHNMTHYLTQRFIGNARPNAEHAWNQRVPYEIPWPRVWRSLGTPLSDASEEKQWRKLLHRALFTRNRDSRAPSKRCRLGCNCDESMIHLAQCPRSSHLWPTLLSALQAVSDKVPDVREVKPMERGAIFGVQDNRLGLLPPLVRATFRHAWQALYRNLTIYDQRGIPFSLPRVVLETLEALRDAALRLGKANILKRFRDGDEDGFETVLPPIVTPLINIDAVSERPHVKVVLSGEFDSVLRIARNNVTPANP